MKKVLKILLIFVAAFLIVFGIAGGIIELTSEGTDLFGVGLSVVFIIIGGSLLNLGIRGGKDKASETPEPEAVSNAQPVVPTAVEGPVTVESVPAESLSPFWQRKALVISSWVELVFFALGIIFALIFGVAGFVAGEMGAMVGIIMVMVLVGIAMVVSVRIVALWGLVKEKSWAPVLNLILSVVESVLLILSGAWPVLVYTAFTGWCSVYLIRHKSV
ncbi:MAG: hypothetical protein DRP60_16280 [Spirochaetes bacterium]|nr:MAG: hypothetical protein DRP60_16280 [Spirochaetota bacterium]